MGVDIKRGPFALCPARRYIPLAHDPEKWTPVFRKRSCANKNLERDIALEQVLDPETPMRAEIERLVEEIKQSVGLLRRHL
jgi:hypothetical protein